jgi:hypothetical protein
MRKTQSRSTSRRRARAFGAVKGPARDLVRGADEHIEKVRKAIWRQAFIAVGLAVTFRGLAAWNDLSARLGGDSASTPAIRAEPTSGSNILAAYALLGALLFALQVSVRSLNNETDITKQLDPAELGRRQMVEYIAVAAGSAAFGLGILCLYWYGNWAARLDLFRVIGPIGASVVLAAISADIVVTTEAPHNSRLRMELEKQALRKAEEAYGRVPQVTEGLKPGLVAFRVVFLVLAVSAASWMAWFFVLRGAPAEQVIASAVFAVIATLLTCWASVEATAFLARREVLQSFFTITMAILILILYAGETFLAFFQDMGQNSLQAVYRTVLASVALYFGPAILTPLLSLRGFNGNRPGVLVILASLRLRRRVKAIQDAAIKRDERSKLDPAKRRRCRRARTALWLSPLPLAPQLLLRVSDVGRPPDENKYLRRLATTASYAFSSLYLIVALCAVIFWMK